jgi:hypothetical protein
MMAAEPFSIAELRAFQRRELAHRQSMAPRWVDAGHYSQHRMDTEVAMMRAILTLLEAAAAANAPPAADLQRGPE